MFFRSVSRKRDGMEYEIGGKFLLSDIGHATNHNFCHSMKVDLGYAHGLCKDFAFSKIVRLWAIVDEAQFLYNQFSNSSVMS